mgnify:CR=1 FL=1
MAKCSEHYTWTNFDKNFVQKKYNRSYEVDAARQVPPAASGSASVRSLISTKTATLLSPIALSACGGESERVVISDTKVEQETSEAEEGKNIELDEGGRYTVAFFEGYDDFDPDGPPAETMTITADWSSSPVSGNRVIFFQTNEFKDTGRKAVLLEYDPANSQFFDSSSLLSERALSGAIRKISTGDLNDDGVDDFAFALNREDIADSYGENGVNWRATPQVFISNMKTGQFDLVSFGQSKYYHSVDILADDSGTALVALDDGSFWRFDQRSPVREAIEMIEDIQNPVYGTQGDEIFAVGMLHSGGETRSGVSIDIILSRQDEDGNFYKVDQHKMDDSGGKFFQNATSVVAAAPTINVAGDEYSSLGYIQFEKFTDADSGAVYVAGKNSLEKVGDIKGYTTDDSSFQLEGKGVPIYSQVQPAQMIDIFKIEGNELVKIPVSISGSQPLNENFNFFDFDDLDGDGDPDLVLYAINKMPLVYLNDGEFNFLESSVEDIVEGDPKDVPSDGAKTYRLNDFDGNGDLDLLVLPGEWVDPEDMLFEATLIL